MVGRSKSGCLCTIGMVLGLVGEAIADSSAAGAGRVI